MPAISTLTENFQAARDTGKWTVMGANAAFTSDELQITIDTAYGVGLASAYSYTLTGSSLYLNLKEAPAYGSGTGFAYTIMRLENGAGADNVETVVETNTTGRLLKFGQKAAGVSQGETSVTYDPAAHAWVMISEAGGTVTWATSPDSTTWMNQKTQALSMTDGSLRFIVYGGRDSTLTLAGLARLDNVNIAVPPALLPAPMYVPMTAQVLTRQ